MQSSGSQEKEGTNFVEEDETEDSRHGIPRYYYSIERL